MIENHDAVGRKPGPEVFHRFLERDVTAAVEENDLEHERLVFIHEFAEVFRKIDVVYEPHVIEFLRIEEMFYEFPAAGMHSVELLIVEFRRHFHALEPVEAVHLRNASGLEKLYEFYEKKERGAFPCADIGDVAENVLLQSHLVDLVERKEPSEIQVPGENREHVDEVVSRDIDTHELFKIFVKFLNFLLEFFLLVKFILHYRSFILFIYYWGKQNALRETYFALSATFEIIMAPGPI